MTLKSDLLERQSQRATELSLLHVGDVLENADIDRSKAPALLEAFEQSRSLMGPNLSDGVKLDAGYVLGTLLTPEEVQHAEETSRRPILEFLHLPDDKNTEKLER